MTGQVVYTTGRAGSSGRSGQAEQVSGQTAAGPMDHLVCQLHIMTREAVMREMVRVWSEHQDRVRFESFQHRLVNLRYAPTHAEFVSRSVDLVLWFAGNAPWQRAEPHTVSTGVLESHFLHLTSSHVYSLSEHRQTWRVLVQTDKRFITVSDVRLAWKGQGFPWTKVYETLRFLEQPGKKWRSALYIHYRNEPYRVQWINKDEGTMSCQSIHGGYRVDLIEYFLREPTVADSNYQGYRQPVPAEQATPTQSVAQESVQ